MRASGTRETGRRPRALTAQDGQEGVAMPDAAGGGERRPVPRLINRLRPASLERPRVSPHIRWAGLTPKAGRYLTLCGRKISQYVGQSSFRSHSTWADPCATPARRSSPWRLSEGVVTLSAPRRGGRGARGVGWPTVRGICGSSTVGNGPASVGSYSRAPTLPLCYSVMHG